MPREKEIEGEDEGEGFCEHDCNIKSCCKKGKGLLSQASAVSSQVRKSTTKHGKGPVRKGFLSSKARINANSSIKPQDADYSFSTLIDEVELLIWARFPRSEYWKLSFLNKRFQSLLKSDELFKIRREIGFKESSVLMLATGDNCWWSFDREFRSCRKLPPLPSDLSFTMGDKESLCAGTHLIVSGREIEGGALWRYELVENKWFKGPSMINPRCLFASASSGTSAFVAGGIDMEGGTQAGTVLSTAEKYNPDTKMWDPLPRMNKKRKLCSGCYMDNKFYVIGGRDEEGKDLTCGESFDEVNNKWDLIENMLSDIPVLTSRSPPLVAVVNNELYSLEAPSNELKLYMKGSNTWKNMGPVPVRADFNCGWGVAFKSLGNELLVIGSSSDFYAASRMNIYTCTPDPGAEDLNWRHLECKTRQLSDFILNCSIMVA